MKSLHLFSGSSLRQARQWRFAERRSGRSPKGGENIWKNTGRHRKSGLLRRKGANGRRACENLQPKADRLARFVQM
jgi:hypothetical protein